MNTTTAAAATTLTARTETREWGGTTTYGTPELFGEGTHNGHTIALWKQAVVQVLNGEEYPRTASEVLIDGKPAGGVPAGTAKQALAKIAKGLDEDDSNRELLPRVTALMSRETANTRLVDPLTDELSVGDVAMVHGTGSWRRGVVVKVTAQKATVAYTTPSSGGRIFRKADDLDAIRVDVRRPAAPAAPAAEVPAEAPAAEVETETPAVTADAAEGTERAALDTLLGRPTAHRTLAELSADTPTTPRDAAPAVVHNGGDSTTAHATEENTMNADTAAPRYFATRSAGRYRVFDRLAAEGIEVEVAVCSSKAKAEEKAAKLNADAAELSVDEEFAELVEETRAADAAAEASQVAEEPTNDLTEWLGRINAEIREAADPADLAAAQADADADAAEMDRMVQEAERAEDERVYAEKAARDEALLTAAPAPAPAPAAAPAATEPAAEKPRGVRCHKRVYTLLLGSPAAAAGHELAPVLDRLTTADTLSDGGRTIPTTAAERAALREFVAAWTAAPEGLEKGDLRSLTAFLASAWLKA